MHIELHPPMEDIRPSGTVEYLMNFLKETENDYFRAGDYREIDGDTPLVYEDPSCIGSKAVLIVQYPFEVPITPTPTIPVGSTATTIASLVSRTRAMS